jgi:hypothetical protein
VGIWHHHQGESNVIKKIVVFAALLLAVPLAHAQGALSVGFGGTHASRGAYIDVTNTGGTSHNVTGFALNLGTGSRTISIYTKSGTAAGFLTSSGAWTLYATVNVTGKGQGTGTGIAIPAFAIGTGQTYSFYVVSDTDGTLYNSCCDSAVNGAGDGNMSWTSGWESHGLFATTYTGWPFQGTVCYDGGDCGAAAPYVPVEVPTLSEWTLIALSLLVALAAAAHLQRRNRRTAI